MKPAAAPNSASRIKVRKPAIWWVSSSSLLRFSRSIPTRAPRRIAVAKSSATVSSSGYFIASSFCGRA